PIPADVGENIPHVQVRLFWSLFSIPFPSSFLWFDIFIATNLLPRNAFGTTVLISGPSSANSPTQSNTWFQAWAQFVGSTQTVPDQYSWHMEGGGGDTVSGKAGLDHWRGMYGLPERPININEYAQLGEEVPAGSAWFISQ